MIIDSHAHLDMPEFGQDRADVIARAKGAGVGAIITIGIDARSSSKAIELAKEHGNIHATSGIHPNMTRNASKDDLARVARLAASSQVVAIGETGLDYYHDYSDRKRQKKAFLWHLELSDKLGKPLVIHCRQADDDLITILEDLVIYKGKSLKGVIHCFSSNLKTAQMYLKLGLYLSLGGYITYPSARDMADTILKLPLDRLLVETDSPFLPPQKHRGQRNEPSYIIHTVSKLAEIKGLEAKEVSRITAENTEKLFNLKKHATP